MTCTDCENTTPEISAFELMKLPVSERHPIIVKCEKDMDEFYEAMVATENRTLTCTDPKCQRLREAAEAMVIAVFARDGDQLSGDYSAAELRAALADMDTERKGNDD